MMGDGFVGSGVGRSLRGGRYGGQQGERQEHRLHEISFFKNSD
jgi:hypothetical protein